MTDWIRKNSLSPIYLSVCEPRKMGIVFPTCGNAALSGKRQAGGWISGRTPKRVRITWEFSVDCDLWRTSLVSAGDKRAAIKTSCLIHPYHRIPGKSKKLGSFFIETVPDQGRYLRFGTDLARSELAPDLVEDGEVVDDELDFLSASRAFDGESAMLVEATLGHAHQLFRLHVSPAPESGGMFRVGGRGKPLPFFSAILPRRTPGRWRCCPCAGRTSPSGTGPDGEYGAGCCARCGDRPCDRSNGPCSGR